MIAGSEYKEYIGSEHHSEVPVIYSAIGTATALQEKDVEGTPEEYAYHIANAVSKAYEEEYSRIYYAKEVERAEYAVKSCPSKESEKNSL